RLAMSGLPRPCSRSVGLSSHCPLSAIVSVASSTGSKCHGLHLAARRQHCFPDLLVPHAVDQNGGVVPALRQPPPPLLLRPPSGAASHLLVSPRLRIGGARRLPWSRE